MTSPCTGWHGESTGNLDLFFFGWLSGVFGEFSESVFGPVMLMCVSPLSVAGVSSAGVISVSSSLVLTERCPSFLTGGGGGIFPETDAEAVIPVEVDELV